MSLRDWRPQWSADYAGAARAYAADVTATLALFVAASVATGRVWRFAFDDELLTRTVGERTSSASDFALFFLSGHDVHPPLAFMIFHGMVQAGFADWQMRLFSLAMTGLSIVLFHILCLMWLGQRMNVTPLLRSMAVLLYGLCPMAISQGDAIRWYPLFAALTALAVILYLAAGNRAAKHWSAVALGLAASTNFLAVFVALALFLYRYALERKFRWRFEASYWGLALIFGSAGLVTAASIAVRRGGAVATEVFPLSVVNAVAIDALGILGGASVGVGNAWIVVPAALVVPFALATAVNRQTPADPAHLLLLMLLAIPVMALAGFAEPRAFLYLMPVVVTLSVLFIAAQLARDGAARGVLMFALLFATSIGALLTIKQTLHPFKRSAAVPVQEVADFIDTNGIGRALVISTDPVVAWVLGHERAKAGRCVSYFRQNARCLGAGALYDIIIVVSGHNNRSGRDGFERAYAADIARMTAGTQKTASVPFGFDADAVLKQWLTGTPLSEALVTVDLYRLAKAD